MFLALKKSRISLGVASLMIDGWPQVKPMPGKSNVRKAKQEAISSLDFAHFGIMTGFLALELEAVEKYDPRLRYYFLPFIMSWTFGMPGINTSPGFCPGWQGPSHLASITVEASGMPAIGGSYVVLMSAL